jgi:magnesium-transporting ATPase (P-type)
MADRFTFTTSDQKRVRKEILMSASTTAVTSSTGATAPGVSWERFWRMSGIGSVVCFIIAYVLYGYQPPVGASSDALVAFYAGGPARIFIAAVVSGFGILNLMWFAAALRVTLADAGEDGWGAAATASSAAVGGLFILLVSLGAALAYSISRSGNPALLSALNDFGWACFVLTSFPRAMLVMSSAFGLWRAGLISNALFAVGVAIVVLGVLGGTTWVSGGFWAPDGAYSRFVWPILSLVWILCVSQVLLTRAPAKGSGW